MRAFQSIRDDMREACLAISDPQAAAGARPMHQSRGSPVPRREEPDETTHIEPWMEAAFGELSRSAYTGAPFALISCFMNGEPAAVIALTRPDGDNRTHVMPLFVACMPSMTFSGHGDSDEGGGPAREEEDAELATLHL